MRFKYNTFFTRTYKLLRILLIFSFIWTFDGKVHCILNNIKGILIVRRLIIQQIPGLLNRKKYLWSPSINYYGLVCMTFGRKMYRNSSIISNMCIILFWRYYPPENRSFTTFYFQTFLLTLRLLVFFKRYYILFVFWINVNGTALNKIFWNKKFETDCFSFFEENPKKIINTSNEYNKYFKWI